MKNPLSVIRHRYGKIEKFGYKGFDAFLIMLDMIYCRVRFHCFADEYFNYDFMKRKDRERKYFLLRYHQYYKLWLVKNVTGAYGKKSNQYDKLADLIARKYVSVDGVGLDGLKEFVDARDKVIFKPNHGSHGIGVFAYNKSEDRLEEVYNEIKDKDYLCEEFIVQHPEMEKMAPGSVNTIRVITLNDHGKVSVIDTAMRMGAGDKVCDNICNGGYGATVDPKTGIVVTIGSDIERNTCIHHPSSGQKIIGFNVPHWDKVIALAHEAALRIPEIPSVGWDVAITPDGVCLIELNGSYGPRLNQIIDQKPKGKELMAYVDKYKDKKKIKQMAAIRKIRR